MTGEMTLLPDDPQTHVLYEYGEGWETYRGVPGRGWGKATKYNFEPTAVHNHLTEIGAQENSSKHAHLQSISKNGY